MIYRRKVAELAEQLREVMQGLSVADTGDGEDAADADRLDHAYEILEQALDLIDQVATGGTE